MSETIFRSSQRRIFVGEALEGEPSSLALDEASAHYLCKVLRLREGTAVDVADGSGRLFQGVLQADAEGWSLQGLRKIYEEELGAERILIASLIKADRWEWMLEKAAELGVNAIVPLNAERSVVELEAKKQTQRLERWSKIVEGAARQCERLAPVRIEAPVSLKQALQRYPDALFLMLDEAVPKRSWPPIPRDRTLVLLVGPEGGWSDKERALLAQHDVQSCGLGAHVLRAETAAVAALTLVRALEDGIVGGA